jgi:hypothetical protein
MADLRRRVDVEIANIDRVLAELPAANGLERLSTLEPAGVATLLHNFYTGIENVLKQILAAKGMALPQGPAWHKELVALACDKGVVSEGLKERLGEYLGFRHFFSHAYALDLYPHAMEPLVGNAASVCELFKNDIAAQLRHA